MNNFGIIINVDSKLSLNYEQIEDYYKNIYENHVFNLNKTENFNNSGIIYVINCFINSHSIQNDNIELIISKSVIEEIFVILHSYDIKTSKDELNSISYLTELCSLLSSIYESSSNFTLFDILYTKNNTKISGNRNMNVYLNI